MTSIWTYYIRVVSISYWIIGGGDGGARVSTARLCHSSWYEECLVWLVEASLLEHHHCFQALGPSSSAPYLACQYVAIKSYSTRTMMVIKDLPAFSSGVEMSIWDRGVEMLPSSMVPSYQFTESRKVTIYHYGGGLLWHGYQNLLGCWDCIP